MDQARHHNMKYTNAKKNQTTGFRIYIDENDV